MIWRRKSRKSLLRVGLLSYDGGRLRGKVGCKRAFITSHPLPELAMLVDCPAGFRRERVRRSPASARTIG